MKKSDSVILTIVLYGLLIPAVLGILAMFFGEDAANAPAFIKILHDLGGLAFALWMIATVYLCIRLIVAEPFRETVLKKITFLREADEREENITGRATKSTFLVSLAVLLFLLCLSCFQVSFYRVPPEQAINGKTGNVSLGINLRLSNEPSAPAANSLRKDIFSYSTLPISNSAVILLLIILQIGTYNLYVRKKIK